MLRKFSTGVVGSSTDLSSSFRFAWCSLRVTSRKDMASSFSLTGRLSQDRVISVFCSSPVSDMVEPEDKDGDDMRAISEESCFMRRVRRGVTVGVKAELDMMCVALRAGGWLVVVDTVAWFYERKTTSAKQQGTSRRRDVMKKQPSGKTVGGFQG
jgi:hypothetical protein